MFFISYQTLNQPILEYLSNSFLMFSHDFLFIPLKTYIGVIRLNDFLLTKTKWLNHNPATQKSAELIL